MKALILIAVLLIVGCMVTLWLLYKELNQTKRRIKALEDAQRESHEPGYWANPAKK